MHKIAAKWSRNVLDTELRLSSVKPGYLVERSVPTIRDFDSNKHSSESRSNMKEVS